MTDLALSGVSGEKSTTRKRQVNSLAFSRKDIAVKWFWIGFWAFLTALIVSAAMMRPDTVDATLAFVGRFLTVAAWTLFITAIVAIVVGGGIAAWIIVRKHQLKSLRQQDGHYPIQRVKTKNGGIAIIDPNLMVGPVLVMDTATGSAFEYEPAAGWNVQATIRALVQQTRTAEAMFQGDESRSSRWGSEHRGDRITAAAAKLINGPVRPHQPAMPQVPVAQLPAPPTRVYTTEDAFAANTPTKLAMGADTESGEIVQWDMTQAPHLRVHGRTQGAGKTNLIQTLAAGAVRADARVIVLDRSYFKDWNAFRGHAELVDTREPRKFAKAITTMCGIYQQRYALLAQHGVSNIAALPEPQQRIVIVISEFGALCATAQNEGVLDDVLYPLTLILREAGAAGVHVLIEDQVVDQRWPRGISANAEPVTGYLPVNSGSAGGYWDAHKLAPYQFHFGGTIFNTWPMAAVLPMVLGDIKQRQPAAAAIPSQSKKAETTPITVEGWYAWATRQYLPSHPEILTTDEQGRGVGVKALAEAMATVANKDYEAMKGMASTVARQLRENYA